MSRIIFTEKFEDMISVENLLEAWLEFVKGKRSRADVQEFERHLMENIFSLRALDRFTAFGRIASSNHRKTVWVLKCDIRKFFASISHNVLLGILRPRIIDDRVFGLLENVIRSFSTASNVGLPLGNLTWQLFANVYMNELDQFVKHRLHVKHYIRYADDFVFLSFHLEYLESLLSIIRQYLLNRLHLELHPQKVELRTIASGVDFLGWVHFPDHRVLRRSTKRRMLSAICQMAPSEPVLASYEGMLKFGNAFGLRAQLQLVQY